MRGEVSRQVFIRYMVCNAANFVLFACCYLGAAMSPSSTFEGLLPSLLVLGSMGLSIGLTLFGLFQIAKEIWQRKVSLKTVLATVFAAAPLLIFPLVEQLGRKPYP